MALCLQYNIRDPIFSESFNWNLSYDLPNETHHAKNVASHSHQMNNQESNAKKERMKRRAYRDFQALMYS